MIVGKQELTLSETIVTGSVSPLLTFVKDLDFKILEKCFSNCFSLPHFNFRVLFTLLVSCLRSSDNNDNEDILSNFMDKSRRLQLFQSAVLQFFRQSTQMELSKNVDRPGIRPKNQL